MAKARILFLDIETKPAIVYTFGIRDQHITHKQIKQDGGTICVGVKWYGERAVTVYSEWEHGYSGMIARVHDLLGEAEAVCTYNGARFDIPKLQGNFLLEGLPPPPPPTQIDVFQAVRKKRCTSGSSRTSPRTRTWAPPSRWTAGHAVQAGHRRAGSGAPRPAFTNDISANNAEAGAAARPSARVKGQPHDGF